jgi:DNA-binding response OmpR family regulator
MIAFEDLSVLLVEDEFLIALDAEQILRDMGVRAVEIAATFEAASRRAAEGRFDLVVLDVNINGQLSFPIAKVLQQRGVPVVFASGYELRDRPLPGFEGGICVTKPYTGDRLREAMATVLADRARAP